MVDKRVLVLAGPTGSGKTTAAVQLAKRLNGEIVSADATHVYRELHVGTGKLSVAERQGVPHYLVDILPLTDYFSAGRFASSAVDMCDDILARGKTPIVVGGSILYLKMLMWGPNDAPAADIALEMQLEAELQPKGWSAALDKLNAVDPEHASTINRNDWRRMRRALSVYHMTGRPLSSFKPKKPVFDFYCAGLSMDSSVLMNRIASRCEYLVDRGIIEETIQLWKQYDLLSTRISNICGYHESLEYIQHFWLDSDPKNVARLRKHFYRFLKNLINAYRQQAAMQTRFINKAENFVVYRNDPFEPPEELVERIAVGFLERNSVSEGNCLQVAPWTGDLELYEDLALVDMKTKLIQHELLAIAKEMRWEPSCIASPEDADRPPRHVSKRHQRYQNRLAHVY